MKKALRKVLVLTLISTLVLSGSSVFAASEHNSLNLVDSTTTADPKQEEKASSKSQGDAMTPAATTTVKLPANTWKTVQGRNPATYEAITGYFKITASKTGYISVNVKELGLDGSSCYMTLLNSSKKAVSSKIWYYTKSSPYNKMYFGVKKGGTYYIKVTGAYGASPNYQYQIKYGIKSVKNISASSKKKAAAVGVKKTKTSVFCASRSHKEVDWYKIKVKKKKATSIAFYTSGVRSGNIIITVYKGSKRIGSSTISRYTDKAVYKIYSSRTYGKADKGTYYVKVKQGKNNSGKYSFRYVK